MSSDKEALYTGIRAWLHTLKISELDQLMDDIKAEKIERAKEPELVGSLGPVFQVYPHSQPNDHSEK